MNANTLLDGIGDVKGSWIWDAQQVRTGERPASGKRLPGRKLWLVAAVLVLSLLLVGCAIVYALRLQDMAFGQKTQEFYDGSVQEMTLLSIQGVKGTPGYQATKEWYEWLENYDTDMSVYHSEEAFSEDFGDAYYAYNLYSREMKDKLDEICEKYGLELLGKMYDDPDVEAGCQAIGIPGIFRPEVQAEADWGQIAYYANGSFRLEGRVTLENQTERIYLYRCNRKDAFTDLYGSIGPEGTYEEWVYTTSYGVDVLMVRSPGGARGNVELYAEQGDYVFLLSCSEFEDMPLPSREEMERCAEAFDFSVQPQYVTQENIQAGEERRKEADAKAAATQSYYVGFQVARNIEEGWHPPEGYRDSIAQYLDYVREHDDGQRQYFSLRDIDGDGTAEVFLGNREGKLMEMLKMEDGMVSIRFCHYLCQGDVLERCYTSGFVEDAEIGTRRQGLWYVFESGKELVMQLMYDAQLDAWRTGDGYWNSSTPVTKEQAQEILDGYPHLELEMRPIGEYPG